MYTITDSICLKILSTDCLLVAIGNELHFYQQIGRNTIHKHQTTGLYDKIHGIQSIQKSVTEFEVIIYGGRELALILVKDQNFTFMKSVTFSDWINSINFYENQPSSFCLLTSHSVAVECLISWQDDDKQACIEISKKLSCPDKSTLYSSLIEGTSWNSSVFFGGTALGDVFIWKEVDEQAVMLRRLNGHNGVIFSINCNVEHGILTTTSDDRSVKIWKIDSLNGSDWGDCSIKAIKAMYGHVARVFRSKIIIENGSPYIITIGEDSSVCVWSESGSLLCRKHFNCGATLWNLDYDSAMKAIFICASDGNLREVSLRNVFDKQKCAKEAIPIDVLGKDEYLSKVRLLDKKKIIALTNCNRLVYQNATNDWVICSFQCYKSCLLEKFDKYVAIAGYKRASVFEYGDHSSLSLIYETNDLQNMVRSFKFLSENEYLLCDEIGNCVLVNRSTGKKIIFSLPRSKDACITAALIDNEFLFVSDRTGDLHLFEIELEQVHRRHQLKQVHGNLGCTVIIREHGRYITSGHDGTLKVIALDRTCKTMSIELTKKLSIIWVDRVICCNGEKLYAGFNDKHFVFANSDCDIIDEIDCGGGHRFWDLIVNENFAEFLFIRNKVLHRVTLMGYADEKEKRFRMPLFKWHMKSCNSVQCVELENGNVIAVSGGDDNVMKFNQFSSDNEGRLEHITDVVTHISSVKSIFLVQQNQNQWWIISAGGRAQICVNQMTTNEDQIDIKEVTSFMLNSSDFQRKRWGKSQLIDFDPETRFMSVTCTDDFHIYAGCSDGYIRQFYFDPNNRRIEKMNSTMYGKCLLHVHHLNYESSQYLLTMATDGFICFWRIMDNKSIDSEPFHRLQHHNSGINSFDVILLENRFLIATGGDDQSTVLSYFRIKQQCIEVTKTIRLHYHTAQVNGMKFSINDSCLYTVSVDQIVYKIDLQTFAPQKHHLSTISDAKGLCLIQKSKILVYGCGIQFFNSKS